MAYPFIVLEGIDGSGKETQVAGLVRFAKRKRARIFVHKYPTENAKKIKEHLSGKADISQDELLEMFAKDILAGQEKLKDELLKGWVIADRYCISTAAYQGIGGKLEQRMEQVKGMGFEKPDLVIWLDLSPEEAMKRKARQKILDRNESDLKFLKEVRANFEKLYGISFMCKKWKRIDASAEPKKVSEEIRKALEPEELRSAEI